MSDLHDCPAPGCKVQVPYDQLACRTHWYMIPKQVRSHVWKAFNEHGQGSPEHTRAITEAMSWLEEHA